ncbi:MAG: divalent cation tolerance protein CutA, partial [Alphaproteobacteria bacterium]
EEGDEVIVLFKTRAGKVKDIIFALEGLHTYDVPPIEVLSVEEANQTFQKWINDETV